MGIDFSHCNAHWSYIGFHKFRLKLAKLAEIPTTITEDRFEMEIWEEGHDDNIMLLLEHSDCDGELKPDECKKVLPRLESLVGELPEDDPDKKRGGSLILGLKACIDAGESLEFL